MSKNGYRLFRNYDPYITSPFGYRINPITKVRSLHAGVDYGTNGKNLPTYALENGKVIKTGYSTISGNFVYVNYPRLGKNGLYEHLDSIKVKELENVTKDTIIGYVGATGEVTGVHLHFGFFPESDQVKGWYDRNWEDFEAYDYKEELPVLGTPSLRDEKKFQLEVIISNLRVRSTPNGEILGYLKPGVYDILDSKVLANYTWYQISANYWVAYSSEFAKLYEVKAESPADFVSDKKEEVETPKEEEKSANSFSRFFKKVLAFFLKLLKKIGLFK